LAAAGLSVPASTAQERTSEQILADYDAVKAPQFEREKAAEEGYREKFFKLRSEAAGRRAALIGELYRLEPKHEKLNELLPKRWSTVIGQFSSDADLFGAVRKEIDGAMDGAADAERTKHAYYWNTQAAIGMARAAGETSDAKRAGYEKTIHAATNTFIKKFPKDDRGPRLLMSVAGRYTSDTEDRVTLYRRIIDSYPDYRGVKYVPGKIRQSEGMGKPFQLEFNDAIGGQRVSVRRLKDKVVVVDFWATWCGPCVAEMPHMKELYAKYRDKGVEFVGVSLDDPEDKGGLEKLKNYCKENEITWPQYYQGNRWKSEFSTSWGINSIPTMFVIDKDGKLHSIEAGGKLDTMLPELLGLPVPKADDGG
jgi:thiol-disulfide isomerase/thioredoxin